MARGERYPLRETVLAMDARLTAKDLSEDQAEVFSAMTEWSHNPKGILRIGGFAGSGKSTLLGIFAANTKLRVAYCSFTGRAASVLSRKLRAAGSPSQATTIHRLIYLPIIQPKTDRILGWKRRPRLNDEFDLVVIDEASMVSGALLEDLLTYEVPILAVGDHGQLPPVADSGDLMRDPDLRLEQIHRQAAGNPIIQLAHRVRQTGELEGFEDAERIVFAHRKNFGSIYGEETRFLGPIDVGVICWTNKNRILLNGLARKALGFRGPPGAGEIVICLRNEPPIFNGMRGRLVAPAAQGKKPWELEAQIEYPEEGLPPRLQVLCAAQFNREKTYESVEELQERGIEVESIKAAGSFFDFGYAMTCHKSQGSSFETVILYLDRRGNPDDEQWRRWAYTAATRASERLVCLQ